MCPESEPFREASRVIAALDLTTTTMAEGHSIRSQALPASDFRLRFVGHHRQLAGFPDLSKSPAASGVTASRTTTNHPRYPVAERKAYVARVCRCNKTPHF
jgi:hypothetical protein